MNGEVAADLQLEAAANVGVEHNPPDPSQGCGKVRWEPQACALIGHNARIYHDICGLRWGRHGRSAAAAVRGAGVGLGEHVVIALYKQQR